MGLSYFQWEWKIVQLLWKTVWQFLKNITKELPYHPAVLLQGIYPREMQTYVYTDIAALVIIAKNWKEPKCPPTTSSSVITFSSCLQPFQASGSFPVSQLFTSGDRSIGASASVLPMNSQDWSSEWTGWTSLQSKVLSRVFSNTTVQKHQIFSAQPSLWSNFHIHATGKTIALTR